MKKIFLHIAVFLGLLFSNVNVNAQPFAMEIAAFKKADSIAYPFPNAHPIVFAGSSSFRMWKTLQADFDGYPVLNRGFGGSTLLDVIRYAEDVIIKYQPRQVVIYCGENDLAASAAVTGKDVFKRFKTLFYLLRHALPNSLIAFVSIKPSPSRQHIQPAVKAANARIRKFLQHQEMGKYIDVYSLMMNADGTMKKELFLEDDLHMNAQGYAIWKKAIEPYLLRQ